MKKKIRIRFIPLMLMGILLMLSNSCKKEEETVTDIEGNVYHTVTIGTQVWMVENLKVTKYRNGDPIPNITNLTQWGNLTTSAYAWYNNDVSNKAIYGALYNWFALNDNRHIAPVGWHIPSYIDFIYLIDFLGGPDIAGGKLKESGFTHWSSPNIGATNESGFTALPGGYIVPIGVTGFTGLNNYGFLWSSMEAGAANAWDINLHYDLDTVIFEWPLKVHGFSVRCIKD